jgi:hypothetical protein
MASKVVQHPRVRGLLPGHPWRRPFGRGTCSATFNERTTLSFALLAPRTPDPGRSTEFGPLMRCLKYLARRTKNSELRTQPTYEA